MPQDEEKVFIVDDDNAVMRFGRRMQPIDRFGDDVHRGIESKGVIGAQQVVVNGFGNTNYR